MERWGVARSTQERDAASSRTNGKQAINHNGGRLTSAWSCDLALPKTLQNHSADIDLSRTALAFECGNFNAQHVSH